MRGRRSGRLFPGLGIMRTTIFCLVLGSVNFLPAFADHRGVLAEDLELRSLPKANAPVVAMVRAGEVFEFQCGDDADWCGATLDSGKSGWLPAGRIRMHHTINEIPEKDEPNSEVGHQAATQGFDYCATARAAALGDPAALRRYFAITDTDGAAAEGHSYYSDIVIHILGDAKLAAFLEKQPIEYRLGVRNHFAGGMFLQLADEADEAGYGERHFPLTTGLLCRQDLTDWPSPDGRFAIHKRFSKARVTPDSKVEKAKLVETATGRVVADLTGDDIASGIPREGRILWSPDSKSFAHHSGGLAMAGKTVVWSGDGSNFARKELPKIELPGRSGDAELVGAELQWEQVEPLRWLNAETLELQLHDYFEKLREDRSIHGIGRTYLLEWKPASGELSAEERKFE